MTLGSTTKNVIGFIALNLVGGLAVRTTGAIYDQNVQGWAAAHGYDKLYDFLWPRALMWANFITGPVGIALVVGGCLVALRQRILRGARALLGLTPRVSWILYNPPKYHFLALVWSTYDGSQIIGFQARGRNDSSDPIQRVSGWVRSDITNEALPLLLSVDQQLVPPERTTGIPPQSNFIVGAHFPERMPSQKFLAEFGGVTFHAECDGEVFTKRFSAAELKTQIRKCEDEAEQNRRRLVEQGVITSVRLRPD